MRTRTEEDVRAMWKDGQKTEALSLARHLGFVGLLDELSQPLAYTDPYDFRHFSTLGITTPYLATVRLFSCFGNTMEVVRFLRNRNGKDELIKSTFVFQQKKDGSFKSVSTGVSFVE